MIPSTITCTYIGHATTLIEAQGHHLLTDPHLSRRVLFFKRHGQLPIDPSTLPPLSAILLSHAHEDHLDVGSFRFIKSSTPVFVPENTERIFGHLIRNPIIELSHFASHDLANGISITAVPVHHRGRWVSPFRRTPANGYIIRAGERSVFFCGDSAYGEYFNEIRSVSDIDLALLPISGYLPHILMRHSHMTPAEAVTAFEDLTARHMMPICWGTFSLSLEGLQAPITWLEKIIAARKDLQEKIHIVRPGENFSL